LCRGLKRNGLAFFELFPPLRHQVAEGVNILARGVLASADGGPDLFADARACVSGQR